MSYKSNNKKNKEDTSKIKNSNLFKLCDEIENGSDTSYLINNFYNSYGKPFDYKWAIIFIPCIIYLIIISFAIINVNTVNITKQNESFASEFVLSIYAFIIMFISYFIIDFLYQNSKCRGKLNTSVYNILSNCFYNSLYVSTATFLGYLLATRLENPDLTSVHNNIIHISWYRNVSNHKNNLILSIIFYFMTILYINPITNQKKIISRNLFC